MSGPSQPAVDPAEMLLRTTRIQAVFSVRFERMLIEPIDCNPLFSWLLGLEINAPVWRQVHPDPVRSGSVPLR